MTPSSVVLFGEASDRARRFGDAASTSSLRGQDPSAFWWRTSQRSPSRTAFSVPCVAPPPRPCFAPVPILREAEGRAPVP